MSCLRFNGPDFIPAYDAQRLTNKLLKVFHLMEDGQWRTLRKISKLTLTPEASVSAYLRHLRKVRFGQHVVEKRILGKRNFGLYEYRLIPNSKKGLL